MFSWAKLTSLKPRASGFYLTSAGSDSVSSIIANNFDLYFFTVLHISHGLRKHTKKDFRLAVCLRLLSSISKYNSCYKIKIES